jgi:transcriptional regulator with PAS, ATPase and Fis domain
MDPNTQHLWQWSRIGCVKPDGKIDIMWTSPGPIPPRIHAERPAPQIYEQPEPESLQVFRSLIGRNKRFMECVRMAEIAGRTSSNVLITGESGTGKELFAKAIHKVSARSAYPFVPINCAAIPRDLIASELFGYEEGSFTGARRGGKPGKFELANKGTLFLDEIGEMPIDLQAHLLRVLQEKEVYRIGGTEPIRLDVRVIAATSRDLPQEIAYNASFRGDLYYRLNVFGIDLPPLRERLEDIALLVSHFLVILNSARSNAKTFAPETLEMMKSYPWPGNVRELANVVERAFHVALESRVILPVHLPERIASLYQEVENREDFHATFIDLQRESGDDLPEKASHILVKSDRQYPEKHQKIDDMGLLINDNERKLIKEAIIRSGYNMSRACRLLGISRSTLYRKIRKYGISIMQD